MIHKAYTLSLLFTSFFWATAINADLVNKSEISNSDTIEQLTTTLSDTSVTEKEQIILLNAEEGLTLPRQDTEYKHLKMKKKTYYPDYDELFNPWYIHCELKKFDNTKICSMTIQFDALKIYLINGKYSVTVGSNHYPRSQGGLRIDNSSAIYGYEGELPKPLSIIENLKKGKVAYTRYQEWPYQRNIDSEISLDGFTDRFNEMLKRYKEL